MKRHASLVFTAIAVIAISVGGSLYAQSSQRLHADIPFEFVASNVRFPAGTYDVVPMQPGKVLIRSADFRNAGIVSAIPTQTGKTSSETKLVFNRYGNRYFLSQIWTVGDDTGRELSKSRAEREMARNLKSDWPTDIAATLK